MAQTKLATLLPRLEHARTQIGLIDEREYVRLLSAAGQAAAGRDAESLIRFHDLLLFFRAFPPGPGVLRLADGLLGKIETSVKAVLAAGANPDVFAPEEVTGIAGTVVEATFSYPMACWLVEHHRRAISIQWDDYEREIQRAAVWPRFFPLMEEDSLTEANVPYLDWLKAARGRQDELPWLIERFKRLPLREKEKSALYDSLELMIRWDMSGSRASRTLARKPVRQFYFHRAPLLQRRQVSLAEEFAQPRLPMKVLPRRQAEKTLDLVKEATGVRYRELYGTSIADLAWVVQSNVSRGVEIYFWGLPPEKRLPLRAYLAGFTVKNGVPINYVECISLFDWTEIGFSLRNEARPTSPTRGRGPLAMGLDSHYFVSSIPHSLCRHLLCTITSDEWREVSLTVLTRPAGSPAAPHVAVRAGSVFKVMPWSFACGRTASPVGPRALSPTRCWGGWPPGCASWDTTSNMFASRTPR